MSVTRVLAIGTVLAGLAGFGTVPASAQTTMNEVSFALSPQNNSGLHGHATLTRMGAQTKVTIEMMGGQTMAGPMPAHIHTGTCANLNPAPAFPLTSVTNGKSETTVNVSLDAIMGAPHAINVHKSAQEVSVYVACGELDEANIAGMGQMAMGGQTMGGGQAMGAGQRQGQMGPMLFALQPQNNSGERGAVVLTPMGDQTRVSIRLRGEPAGASQPAHIHDGTCESLNPAPRFPLNNVVNGRSDTVVNASVQQIMSMAHAVNVHKSAQEVSVYVACGNLNQANMMRAPQGPGAGQGPGMAAGQPRPPMAPGMTGPQTQMPRAGMPMGAQRPGAPMGAMPMTMPRTGDVPLEPIAALGLVALGAGLLIRRRR